MAHSTKTRSSKAKRHAQKATAVRKASPNKGPKHGVLAREKEELDRRLYFLRGFESAAAESGKAGDRIRQLAKEQTEEAPPIRIRHATSLLGVSDHTVTEWCRLGILEQRTANPRRVSLGSVLEIKDLLAKIRQAGTDRDFTAALINKLELDEIKKSRRFRASLGEAKRGERGEWPEGF